MNTPSKRASAIGIGLAIRLVLPVPDAVVDQGDRQHVAYCYAGIAAAAPEPRIIRTLQASYTPDVSMVGSAEPTIEFTAAFEPVLELPGSLE